MKGLLLKDFYMARKYCRAYLLIVAVFLGVSFVSADNTFFTFYPCLLCGMIPVNLLSYDERFRWSQYSRTLPYTKGQLVSCKYLIGLFAQLSVLALTAAVQALRMVRDGTFEAREFHVLVLLLLLMSLLAPAISLPFIFRLGVEKGRIAYLVMVGVICALSFLASGLFRETLAGGISSGGTLLFLCLLIPALYALSWYLSIRFYQKRDD